MATLNAIGVRGPPAGPGAVDGAVQGALGRPPCGVCSPGREMPISVTGRRQVEARPAG